jgi:outer membrane protein OmpA-like peptidoglycan-associated protein
MKMRIHFRGFVIFAIWCFISVWLINDKFLPLILKQSVLKTIPASRPVAADSTENPAGSAPGRLTVYFGFNESEFRPDQQTDNKIAELKTWLDNNKSSKLTITGNTDLVGTAGYNEALGLKRAQETKKYLQAHGINPERIIIVSHGESDPVADYLTEKSRAKNRRVEVSAKIK